MKRIFLIPYIIIAFITSANAGGIYNCTDRDGIIIFTDNPQDGMKCVSKDDDIESTHANEAPLATDTKSNIAYAKNINLMPKYGLVHKNKAQLAADKIFLDTMDKLFNGDRKKAAETASMRGWQFLRQEDMKTAMMRFNQAWLLDNKNGSALWGMGAIQCNLGKMDSLQLFSEAEQYMSDDIDFSVDHARTIGMMAVKNKKQGAYSNLHSR
jgi:hypothetical protein